MSRALIVTATLALMAAPAAAASPCPKLLDHRFDALLNTDAGSMCQFAGKVVLVVNTASHCAFTPQYAGLDALQTRYGDDGLVVVGFPSNDFGGQEPGSNAQVKDFCETTYGVQFPLANKTAVVGTHAHPLYVALAVESGQSPRWNFHKYLIDRSGSTVRSYSSMVRPDSAELTADIERLLTQATPR